MAERLGDQPLEPHLNMHEIAQTLDYVFNGQVGGAGRKTGFVLLAFPFGEATGRCNFISNGADRRDVVSLMKELIAHFEGQADVRGRA